MTRRDRNVLFVVVTAVLIGAFWFLVMGPTRKDASTLDKKIAVQEQRLTAAEARVATGQQAKASYQADYAAVAGLGQAVPADDDVASMVYQLDKVADRDDIDFRSLKLTVGGATTGDAGGEGSAAQLPPGAAVGAAGFPAMPFTFNFDGGFFSMQQFLDHVADLTRVRDGGVDVRGRLLTVDKVSLNASRDGFPKVHAEVAATAFVVPHDEGLTNGATPSGPATTTASTDESSGGDAPSTAPATAALTSGGTR